MIYWDEYIISGPYTKNYLKVKIQNEFSEWHLKKKHLYAKNYLIVRWQIKRKYFHKLFIILLFFNSSILLAPKFLTN